MSKSELRVSSCGRFALLTNSTGCFMLVWSKDYAHFMIDRGVQLALITPANAGVLRRAVNESILPSTHEEVSSVLISALLLCNLDIAEGLMRGLPVLYDEGIIRAAIQAFEKRHSAANN